MLVITIVQSSMIDLCLMLEIRKSFQLGFSVRHQLIKFLITILKNMKITEDSQ